MPLTVTDWLPFVALLLMVTVAFFVFGAVPAVGVKLTVNVQLVSADSVPPLTHGAVVAANVN